MNMRDALAQLRWKSRAKNPTGAAGRALAAGRFLAGKDFGIGRA